MSHLNWSILFNVATKGRRLLQRLLGFSSVGVKALVINAQNQVLLIKHTYIDGWHLPGGGVALNETPYEAVIRELQEETGIVAKSPSLFAIYTHQIWGARDYPLVYLVTAFDLGEKKFPCHEIKEAKWFDVDNLPQDTTESTRQRLTEYQEKLPPSPYW